jgi:hypothetical protein
MLAPIGWVVPCRCASSDRLEPISELQLNDSSTAFFAHESAAHETPRGRPDEADALDRDF